MVQIKTKDHKTISINDSQWLVMQLILLEEKSILSSTPVS